MHFFLQIQGMYKWSWGWGHEKVSSCHTHSLDICFQPLEIIFPFPKYFSITGFLSHQRQHSFASSQSCVLNLKSTSWQLSLTKTAAATAAAAAAVGIPSQRRGPCCWVEFPNMRSEWAIELVVLWGTASIMTSPIQSCVLGGASERGVGYSELGVGFGRHRSLSRLHRIKWIDQRWLQIR